MYKSSGIPWSQVNIHSRENHQLSSSANITSNTNWTTAKSHTARNDINMCLTSNDYCKNFFILSSYHVFATNRLNDSYPRKKGIKKGRTPRYNIIKTKSALYQGDIRSCLSEIRRNYKERKKNRKPTLSNLRGAQTLPQMDLNISRD